MGDTIEGSSGAARRALSEDNNRITSGKPGFLRRIISALTPSDAEATGAALPGGTPRDAGAQPHGMVNLRRMRVEDVAIPRVEIIAVSDEIRKDELVDVFRESGLSRVPVFTGTLDTPSGLIHLKDLALNHGFNGSAKNGRFSVDKLIRPLLFAPPSMPIGVLLQKMQSERIHMALVIDEYGGVDGLVTIEDLIEQVIGEIEDEHDTDEAQLWFQEKPGCYVAEARTPLEEFEAEIGVDLRGGFDDDEIDTLGGLVFVLSGHVPARGEMIRHPAGPDFEVLDADPRRIKRLRVHMGFGADGGDG